MPAEQTEAKPITLRSTNDQEAGRFYASVLRALNDDHVPFLVAGTYALERHTGVTRPTKDLDLFIREEDWPKIVAGLERRGMRTELAFSHWLGKAHDLDGTFVDFVFAGGNGLGRVDYDWFPPALEGFVHGVPVRFCAAEELIWSKAFLMERERFDGADVLHLLRARAATLDWERLLWRFGPHWLVLLAHLVLFDFVYPAERDVIPPWVKQELMTRYQALKPSDDRRCAGPLLSRSQYLVDIAELGYDDTRVVNRHMTAEQVAAWTPPSEA